MPDYSFDTEEAAITAWNTRTNNHAELVDDRPDFVGDPICKIASYNECHETALELGYPSLTEALEHLSELKESHSPHAELVEALRDIAENDPLDPWDIARKALSLYGGEKG